MRRAAACALSIGVLLVALADPSRGAVAGADSVTPDAAPVRTVTLVTGDRVGIVQTPAGRPSVTLTAPDGAAASAFRVLESGSHLYVIPQDAAGFVGAPLDLSLFDVNALPSSSQAVPLTVEYAAGNPARALPGTALTGQQTLALTDRAAFGRAMAGGHAFDGVRRLALASAQPAAAPAGKLYTLTVKAFDRLGHRVNGSTAVAMNADNVENYLGAQAFFNGEVAFSVPAGAYSVDTYIGTGYRDGTADFTLAAAPEVNVTRDTTVILDARKGTRFTASTSQPTSQVVGQLNYQRNGAVGVSFTDSFTAFGTTPLYATPTAQVHTGQLYFYPGLRLGDTTGSVDHVMYDLEFPYVGAVPADLSQAVGDSELATVDAHYHSAVPGRAEIEARQGSMPWQAVSVFAASNVVAPLRRTEYVLPQPDLAWLQFVAADGQDFFGFIEDALRTYQPGEQSTVDWAAQPMAPGIQQQLDGVQACPACRSGDTLGFELWGYTDGLGRLMLPDPSMTESLALYQDGTQVGQARGGFASFPVGAAPASYRLVYDASRQASWWPSSTQTHTEWTFPSSERPADRLPPGWTCGGKAGGGGGRDATSAPGQDGGCSFEPLLFARYSTGASVDDVVPANGPATVEVNVAHQIGAAASPVTSFAAQVSYDDGTSWTDVPATRLGDGHYRLAYSQPPLDATSGFASLHVAAADAAGSAIDQTITRAYPLAVTAPVPPPSGRADATPMRACATPTVAPYAQCTALVNAAAGVSADEPTGYGPADIRSAYRIPARGQGRTVAIVDAYDNPNAEADLAAYREHYGLPPCTSANGCFRKVNQHGAAGPLPNPDPGWGLEISLDLDAVSAACPACKIVLVEADSSNLLDLLPAAQAAAALGVDAISNSYDSRGEFAAERLFEPYYRDLRVPMVFSTGDYGYGNGAILIGGIGYPSASQYVVAVGGTSLVRDSSARGWAETAWDGATSGCSAYIHKPGWQKDQLCDMRTVADISADADPATGLAVYDTFGFDGWLQVGGTSLAAPLVASMYAMAGITAQPGYPGDIYRDRTALFDVVGGSNGTNCSGTYLCNAVPGYDGPTGLGSPDASAPYWTG
jgi:hypothetical protein